MSLAHSPRAKLLLIGVGVGGGQLAAEIEVPTKMDR